MRRALITGITGQDGSYLAELLLEEGWEVHGLVRRVSTDPMGRIRHLQGKVTLHGGDICDFASVLRVIQEVQPEHLYHLAAQSLVSESFRQPFYTQAATGHGALNVLEALRLVSPQTRVYQASSSEMFGNSLATPQNEGTPFQPASPYAVAKVQAHYAARLYREAYGMFVVPGILFNHESPRRGIEFVTRKIVVAVAAMRRGELSVLKLGNLEARRDWGWAPDYVRAMRMMLDQPSPGEYVVATGEDHSVMEFARLALGMIGRKPEDSIVVDPALCRPKDVAVLKGDATLARKELGWVPTVGFEELVERMLKAEVDGCAPS